MFGFGKFEGKQHRKEVGKDKGKFIKKFYCVLVEARVEKEIN